MAGRGCSGNQDAWRSRPSDDGTTGQPRVKLSRTSRGRAANTASGPGHSALWSSKVWVGASPWKPRALVIFSYLPGVVGLGVAFRSGVGRIVCCWLHCSSVMPGAPALLPLTPRQGARSRLPTGLRWSAHVETRAPPGSRRWPSDAASVRVGPACGFLTRESLQVVLLAVNPNPPFLFEGKLIFKERLDWGVSLAT